MGTEQRMTAGDARHFDRTSISNAARVMAERGCGCEPYIDVFTYKRWRAQGFQVQRGERAIKLPLVLHIPDEEGDELGNGRARRRGRKRLGSSSVFCRCQVQPTGSSSAPAPDKPESHELVVSYGSTEIGRVAGPDDADDRKARALATAEARFEADEVRGW